jgi:hypothetical protein
MGQTLSATPPGEGWAEETTDVVIKALTPGPPGEGWVPEGTSMTTLNAPMPKFASQGMSDINLPQIGAFDQLRANLPPDLGTKIKRYAEIMGINENQFGVKNGEIVVWDGKELVPVVPNIGGSDPTDTLFRAGENWAAAVPGILPSAAGLGGGLLTGLLTGSGGASIPAAGIAATATDAARQWLDKSLAEEPTNPFGEAKYDYGSMAKEAALNTLAQGGGVGLSRLATRNPYGVRAGEAGNISRAQIAEWQALMDEGTRRGINLSTPQVTNLSSLQQRMRQLGRYDETIDDLTKFAEEQRNVQVPRAVQKELDTMAPQTSIDDAVGASTRFVPRDAAGDVVQRKGLRGAATDILDDAREMRTRAASPYYEEALNSGVAPNIDSTLDLLRGTTKRYVESHPAHVVASKAINALTTKEPIQDAAGNIVGHNVVPLSDYRKLHSVKETMDSDLTRLAGKVAPAALKEAERAIVVAQRQLTRSEERREGRHHWHAGQINRHGTHCHP